MREVIQGEVGKEFGVHITATTRFRWRGDAKAPQTPLVLEQLYAFSNGDQQWRKVPTEYVEEQT